MKHYYAFYVLAFTTIASCQSPEMIAPPEYEMKTLLHQKRWKVVSMLAERKSDGEILDWYAQLPACVKDNIFITEAPGTGAVGQLNGEEGNTVCQQNDLTYIPLIAGWKLNDQRTIFAVSLFASGHRMLYGYAMEESYADENWILEELNEEFMQIRVDKVLEEENYTFALRFEVIR
ncbi:hypothetical protein WJR50_29155 [Catalinimonas sp. 4WD22]|uniref:hypothetical protein n=1 Tax=Catalinimonas locisalis TaxID=3133978 RepID=UPI0031012104